MLVIGLGLGAENLNNVRYCRYGMRILLCKIALL